MIKLNRRERKAQQLLKHYETCERLAIFLGVNPVKVDGRKISVELCLLERHTHKAMEHACSYPEPFYSTVLRQTFGFAGEDGEKAMDSFTDIIAARVSRVFEGKHIPGLLINRDPKGYALKINPENPEGAELIAKVKLHKDWGGYGILSPEINGD